MPQSSAPMAAEEFFREANRYFGYLLVEHGFAVAKRKIADAFDVCEIMLQAQDWRVRIGRERGAVYVYIGPASDPETWFTLGVVITFLQRDRPEGQEIWFGPRLGWSLDYNVRLELLLQWYAETLRGHAGQIAALFHEHERERSLSQLWAWKEYKDRQAKAALARGDYPTYHT